MNLFTNFGIISLLNTVQNQLILIFEKWNDVFLGNNQIRRKCYNAMQKLKIINVFINTLFIITNDNFFLGDLNSNSF